MNIRPLRNRIVVKPVEQEEQTAGGIYLPDTAKEKPQQAEVVAVGSGEYVEATGETIAPPLNVGDRVFYGKYAGTEVTVAGEDYKILEVKDVLAKIEQ
ncbi:MAG: co-chaperone GroES [Planctomycetota bacterium]|jgi:chaperonin GroES